jgi:glutaredoxin-related protein
MNRPLLAPEKVSQDALSFISNYHQGIVNEVANAVNSNKVVVVGMSHNPFVGKAKKALVNAGIDFKYLEYGNYWSMWRPRLAIKLWSGWPTYPQVFVEGKLIGGFKELDQELKSGKIKK